MLKAFDAEYGRDLALKFFNGDEAFERATREFNNLHTAKHC